MTVEANHNETGEIQLILVHIDTNIWNFFFISCKRVKVSSQRCQFRTLVKNFIPKGDNPLFIALKVRKNLVSNIQGKGICTPLTKALQLLGVSFNEIEHAAQSQGNANVRHCQC